MPRRSRAATPPPAGACRSRRPAACSRPICRPTAAPSCSPIRSGSRPGSSLREGRRVASTAASWSAAAGRTAAGSRDAEVLFAGCFVESADRAGRRAAPAEYRGDAPRAARDPRHLAHARPARHRQPRRRRPGAVRARDARVLAVRRAAARPSALPLPGLRLLRPFDRRRGAGQRARHDRGVSAFAAHKVGQGSTRTLAERSATHAAVAEAEAALRAARLLYYAAIEAAWEAAHREEPVVSRHFATTCALAATHAVRASADVVRSLYDLAGGPAIYDDSPVQRRFRDAYTATAHFQVNAASRELQGRLLLGQPADTLMLSDAVARLPRACPRVSGPKAADGCQVAFTRRQVASLRVFCPEFDGLALVANAKLERQARADRGLLCELFA